MGSNIYVRDAVRGFDRYLDAVANTLFHTDSVKRVRSLEQYIRDSVPAGTVGDKFLSSFVANLREYGNLVAGKKSSLDRAIEEKVGRQIYSVLTSVTGRTGANMIGYNLSSALTSFIPFTQTLATTGKR